MLIHPGNHIGDSWYYVENDKIHCFYLTCPESVERHTAWDIGHATSTDLIHWEIQKMALVKGEPGSYDGRCLATGSILRFKDRYWMAYTGNWNGPQPTVAIAVSDDLYHWDKLPSNPVTSINPAYYDNHPAPSPRDWLHWRDPFLFQYEGMVYHYTCAKSNKGPVDQSGTLGTARSEDMVHWEVLPPPDVQPVAMELECPQVYQFGDLFYLIFSTATSLFSKSFRRQHFSDRERWSSYAMVGTSLFGPFYMQGNGEIIPVDYPMQPYANQIVFWQKQPYLLGTVWNDDQDFICDPIPVEITKSGVKVTILSQDCQKKEGINLSNHSPAD